MRQASPAFVAVYLRSAEDLVPRWSLHDEAAAEEAADVTLRWQDAERGGPLLTLGSLEGGLRIWLVC